MKNIWVLFIFVLSVWAAEAQPDGKVIETVTGKVVDLKTNEPISYTNIGLENTFYGTASDADGNFELKIPAEFTSNNIFFSAVGYKNQKFPVSSLFNQDFSIIKLDPQSYDIENVDIAAQSKVLIRILKMAAENTTYNFIAGPFNFNCTYENEKTVEDTIHTVQNAQVTIFDKTGYTNPSKLNAYQSVKYKIEKKEESESDFRFSTGTTNLDELLEFDLVRTGSSILNPGIVAGFQLKLEGEPVVDGKNCWLISFKQDKPTLAGSNNFYAKQYEGKIIISKDNYAVKMIEGKMTAPKNNRQGKSLAIGSANSNYLENVSISFSVKYNNLKPDFIVMDKNYEIGGEKVIEKSRLIINQVQTTNLTTLNSREYFTGE